MKYNPLQAFEGINEGITAIPPLNVFTFVNIANKMRE